MAKNTQVTEKQTDLAEPSRHGKLATGMTLVVSVVPHETKEWLKERARQEKRSMSNFLAVLIEERRNEEKGSMAQTFPKIVKPPHPPSG